MSKFTNRLQNIPKEWREPIVNVVDTADTIRMGLKDTNPDLSDDVYLIARLTELVVNRKWDIDDAEFDI